MIFLYILQTGRMITLKTGTFLFPYQNQYLFYIQYIMYMRSGILMMQFHHWVLSIRPFFHQPGMPFFTGLYNNYCINTNILLRIYCLSQVTLSLCQTGCIVRIHARASSVHAKEVGRHVRLIQRHSVD